MCIYILYHVCIVYTQNYNIDRTGFMKSWYYNVRGYSEYDNYEIGNFVVVEYFKAPPCPSAIVSHELSSGFLNLFKGNWGRTNGKAPSIT